MSVTSSGGMRRPSRRVGAWALQIVVAAAFLAAGGAKLAGVPLMIQIFDQIGVGQWLRIVTGMVWIVGAFALVYPGMTAIGFFGWGSPWSVPWPSVSLPCIPARHPPPCCSRSMH